MQRQGLLRPGSSTATRTSRPTPRSSGSSACIRWPTNETFHAIARYGHAELRWVQEEPANQGAWPFMGLALTAGLGQPLPRFTRPASSAPATGSAHAHEREQRTLVAAAFD